MDKKLLSFIGKRSILQLYYQFIKNQIIRNHEKRD